MTTYLRCPIKPPKWIGEKVYPLNCEIQIVVGICAEAALCKNDWCPFYDISEEADEVFCSTVGYSSTMQGIQNPRIEGIDEAIYNLLLDLCDHKKIFDLTED